MSDTIRFGGPARRLPSLGVDGRPLFNANAAVWLSECGRWAIEHNVTVMGSIRLNLTHRDEPYTYLTEWCLGDDTPTVLLITAAVRTFLETVPADANPWELAARLPLHTEVTDDGYPRQLRPITRDPRLARALCELAGWDAGQTGLVMRVVDRASIGATV